MNKKMISRAGSIKGLSDAPNLRACAARDCSACKFYQRIEGDWEHGQCTQFDFATESYFVCDAWQERPMEPLPVVMVSEGAVSADNAGETETEGAPAMLAAATPLAIPRYIKSLHLPHDEQFLRDVLAVKFTGKDDIRGYAVLWGDENTVDLEAEFFTPQTDFWQKALGVPRPLSWNHAQDKRAFRAHPVIGKMLEFGEDQVGMFYNAVLDRAHEYRRAMDELIGQRVVGTSSDSAPQYVERVKTKRGATWLKTWPMFAAALTDVPCEPRMLEQGNVYWKAVGVDLSQLNRQRAEATQAAARATLDQRMANAQRQHIELNLYGEL